MSHNNYVNNMFNLSTGDFAYDMNDVSSYIHVRMYILLLPKIVKGTLHAYGMYSSRANYNLE